MIPTLDTPTSTEIDSSQGVIVSPDMSNAVYHAEKKHISRSSAHRYSGIEGGRAQRYAEVYGRSLFSGNTATSFGSIVDAAVECEMRGVDWRSQIAVPPPSVLASDGSRRGKAYQEWRSSVPAGGFECSEADFVKVGDIVDSIREHGDANALLEATTHSQYSVFWTDEHGHQRKARADGCTRDAWFDLKTTSSEWHELKWSFRRFGYDWQANWYTEAAVAAGWPEFVFKFIVVQVFPPHNVKVVWLPSDAVARAGDEIRETLDLMRARRANNDYVDPAYHTAQELVF